MSRVVFSGLLAAVAMTLVAPASAQAPPLK
jgi:hypothetical protein